MSIADLQYRLRLELIGVTKDMHGISPKTDLYQRLKAKRDKILYELEQLGAKRTGQIL